MINQNTI
ncbi:hypothetical protein ACTFIZ_003122 [Dictyostelium cf. discoideum]